MVKRTFSSKSGKLDKKSLKNDENLITFYTLKTGHNLTIKTGDSGSAGFLERKCVMIEAPNLTTINDQKLTQT